MTMRLVLIAGQSAVFDIVVVVMSTIERVYII